MDYDGEIVHLSSSDGTLLEIFEGELSLDDLNYVRSLYVHRKGKRKVTSYHFCLPVRSLISLGTGIQSRYVYIRSVHRLFLIA